MYVCIYIYNVSIENYEFFQSNSQEIKTEIKSEPSETLPQTLSEVLMAPSTSGLTMSNNSTVQVSSTTTTVTSSNTIVTTTNVVDSDIKPEVKMEIKEEKPEVEEGAATTPAPSVKEENSESVPTSDMATPKSEESAAAEGENSQDSKSGVTTVARPPSVPPKPKQKKGRQSLQ